MYDQFVGTLQSTLKNMGEHVPAAENDTEEKKIPLNNISLKLASIPNDPNTDICKMTADNKYNKTYPQGSSTRDEKQENQACDKERDHTQGFGEDDLSIYEQFHKSRELADSVFEHKAARLLHKLHSKANICDHDELSHEQELVFGLTNKETKNSREKSDSEASEGLIQIIDKQESRSLLNLEDAKVQISSNKARQQLTGNENTEFDAVNCANIKFSEYYSLNLEEVASPVDSDLSG